MPEKIDANAASEEELSELLEIDEAIADRIVDKRASLGGFRSIEDLAAVEGVDAALLRRMREKLIVDAPVGAETRPSPPAR